MSRVILKAAEHNWGLMGPGDWETSVWTIRNDRTFAAKASFRSDDGQIPDKTVQGNLELSDYDNIVELINTVWSEEITHACDGTAWEFKVYGSKGALEKHRPLGYIYGIEPFESIVDILKKLPGEEAD